MTGQNHVFPFYHAVSSQPMPHIRYAYEVRSLSNFKKDLDFLLRHYRPMNLGDLLSLAKGESKSSKPGFFLSFDDGLSEIYSVVAPLLISKGIPAAVFVNTDFLDNKELFHRYKASLLLERFDKIGYSNPVTEVLQSRYHLASGRKRCVKEFLLSLSYHNRHVLDEVAELVELDFKAFLKIKTPYLSSLQLKDLSTQGFYIGAHSKNHPRFSEITEDERREQYQGSMEFIQREFKTGYGMFSFPFTDVGIEEEFFQLINSDRMPPLDVSFGTRGLKNDPVPNHFQRIPMEYGKIQAGTILRGEYLYFVLKHLFGKNDVIRDED
jgi:peptidoglycan/xylan/chitin deacetylase (PgdA/CDA1 family)